MTPITKRINKNDFKKVKTVILEDKEEQLESLVEEINTIPNNDIEATGDFKKAQKLVLAGECSHFITDLKIEQRRGNRLVPINAIGILKSIKNKELFVPTVATSIYKDQLALVKNEEVADFCVEKSENSEKTILKHSKSILNDIQRIRGCFYDILVSLWHSCETKDIEDKNAFYKKAKKALSELTYGTNSIPKDHRKAFFFIRNIVSSLSAINSPQIGLHDIKKSEYFLIEKVAIQCLKPNFRMEILTETLDNLMLRGISYVPKINIG